ncbi:MAG: hypothetical protein KIS80_05825 [Anaerolineales bacterium]|nr:hypothetical protein [Anaerolineales bacterium]
MYITCPWCGTNHAEFQSNCKNCGAPLPTPQQQAAERKRSGLQIPPSPPRKMSGGFIWRWLVTDGWSIVAFVFLMLAISFIPAGLGLIVGVVTALIGIPLFLVGVVMLAAAAGVFYWRFTLAQRLLKVLREGLTTRGEITEVRQNYSVQINGRSPWIISYTFRLDGTEYTGTVTTMNTPQHLNPGDATAILYLAEDPQYNGIYPHP